MIRVKMQIIVQMQNLHTYFTIIDKRREYNDNDHILKSSLQYLFWCQPDKKSTVSKMEIVG